MALPTPLFRSSALAKLSSPEQLDQRITLIPPGVWLGTLAGALVVGAALLWGVFGSISTKIYGEGILVRADERHRSAEILVAGTVMSLKVKAGEQIQAGQILAELEQTELEGELRAAEQVLKDLDRDLQQRRDEAKRAIAEREAGHQEQAAALRDEAAKSEAHAQELSQILDGEEKLLRQGLALRLNVEVLRNSRDQAIIDAAKARSRISEASASLLDFKNQMAARVETTADNRLVQQGKVSQLRTRLQLGRSMVAPVAGQVLEIRIGRGDYVRPGDAAITIAETDGGSHEVLAFIEAADGARATEDMLANIIPSTVRKEEYGSMRGRVVEAYSRPASTEEINALLRNPTLTQTFVSKGPPIILRIAVERADTPSGYAWWTGDGPPFAVQAGTLATVEIVVRAQPPITLVLPYLKKLFGL